MSPSLYTRLRWMIQPYYQPRPPKPEPVKPIKDDPAKTTEAPSTVEAETEAAPTETQAPDPAQSPAESGAEAPIVDEDDEVEVPAVQSGVTLKPEMYSKATGFYIHDLEEPLGDVWNDDLLPAPQQAWFHHDGSVHELFSHLVPGAATMFSGRRTDSRNRLRPVIKPVYKDQDPYDRTHLLPFGYHGVESDPRLLIGWDSQQNRGPMNAFEIRQKRRSKPFYWLARITRTPFGATWYYGVWDAKTLELLEEETYEMPDTVFDWQDEMPD